MNTEILRRPALALLSALVFLAVSPVHAADPVGSPDAETELPDIDGAEADAGGSKVGGVLQFDLARTYADPAHWSMARSRLEVGATGGSSDVKWKVSGRADADAVFVIKSGFYPDEVRRDQQLDFTLRETYVDFSAGDVDIRLGRQHIIWGEMVGLFFADVVSARDLRSFYLPDFDQLRIPQWAARAEYYFGDAHAELIWIPVASYDNIGKPGAEFYPLPAGTPVIGELKPSASIGNTNYGGRVSTLLGGWDLSGFYYRSMDVSPTFFRLDSDTGSVFQARHLRISQGGATLTKDLGSFVLKSEIVHTRGREFSTTDPGASFGLVAQNTLEYVFGVDVPAFHDGRINLQYFSRRYLNYDYRIGLERNEDGASILLNTRLAPAWEAEALLVSSLQRTDFMFRPKVVWSASRNWKVAFGIDSFGGQPTGLFGFYDKRDRGYAEARWSF